MENTQHSGLASTGCAMVDGRQTEDGIEAIFEAIWGQLIDHPDLDKAIHQAEVNTQAVGLDGAVNGTCTIADGNAVAVTAVPWTGVLFCNGKNFLVDGKRVYPFDALRVHGVLSKLDMGWAAALEHSFRVACRKARCIKDMQATDIEVAGA